MYYYLQKLSLLIMLKQLLSVLPSSLLNYHHFCRLNAASAFGNL